MKISTVILAGGQSRRMGRDKGGLPVDGDTLLNRVIRRWQGVFGPVAVAVGPGGRTLPPGVRALADLHPGCGPMAGLEAGLAGLEGDAVFLTAMDMPFGDPALARRLAEELGDADGCVIRRESGRFECLFGLYRKRCLPAVSASLDRGDRSFVKGLFPFAAIKEVPEERLAGFDLDRVLFNVNRPEDWQRAQTLLHQADPGM
ncbi:molybdenum cofactor guanylyltransferase [Pseudoflavonifractor sp. 524-17]|uniref:molybdenum cofactor guanylyltransferase n=1 Tax=Pseudoflavonifractor sp. 524-17 TaxID=2304577 RepID=UPI001379EBB4|nr:molybdenum cofactor guanylyltransferase [Pseudoflavonifractor sp. 524-17]NCE65159.1 molybdenum cofactor guanylyltransferase [Pseudoflavonifractor sp. 524-17]